MTRRKTENFYRCEPEAALKGMIGLSLEERGVYRTLIDLMYLQWRPLAYDSLRERQYVVQWVGAAAQKVNPIIGRLVEMGRLHLIEIDGSKYLTDDKFERERGEFKGEKPGAKSGDVDAKSGDVGPKSGDVETKSRLCDPQNDENQDLTRARIEENREDNKPLRGLLSSVADATKRVALPHEGQASAPVASGHSVKGKRGKPEPEAWPVWAGDPRLRERVSLAMGEGFARTYLDPATPYGDAIKAKTHYAYDKLRGCAAIDVVVLPP